MDIEIPEPLKDEPLFVNAYGHESPRPHPWRPFDEKGHEKIGPSWGDLTWRGMTFFLLIALVFVIIALTFGPLHSWS